MVGIRRSLWQASKRYRLVLLALAMAVALVAVPAIEGGVEASQFPNRSLQIASPVASAVTSYTVRFQYPSVNAIGSLRFQFCDNPLVGTPCNLVPGLDVSGATLTSQSGVTGFSLLSTTQNEIILTRPPAANSMTNASYSFSGVVNPSIVGTFYMRITSYTSVDATGVYIDEGGTTASTVQTLNINVEVPPILIFCVATHFETIDCSGGEGTLVTVGTLTPVQARYGSSEMVIATNAGLGYVITVNGPTMAAGVKTIPALTLPTPSAPGTSQFGMNLVANGDPPVGANPDGPGANASISTLYDTANRFTYEDGSIVIANPGVTNYKRFTTSYLVNVSPNQSPGYYATTLTYTATATF